MNTQMSGDYENKENTFSVHKINESSMQNRNFGADITNNKILVQDPKPKDHFPPDYSNNDIFALLYTMECNNVAKFGYLRVQSDINERMRAILVDWLTEVHLKFKLVAETLYLAVDIMDRYLEKVPITKLRLQLVGVTAMLIASKFEDIYAPEIGDFVYITDRAYDRDMIIGMEASVLKTLEFNISSPNILLFLEHYCEILATDRKNAMLARYFAELTLADYSMLKYRKSLIAAASLFLMHKVMAIQPPWPESLKSCSPYNEEDLKICSKDLCILFQKAARVNLQSVRKKFSLPVYYSVATTQINNANSNLYT